jgi:putative dehydrogenase
MSQTVGMLGIGIMGSAMSANLMRAGFEVVGYDVLDERLRAFAGAGGIAAHSLREVAERAEILISVLPSAAALDAVAGPDGICAAARPGLVLVESSTLPIEDKQRARETLAAGGTGAQAVTGDLSVYGSGERAAYDRCLPVFAGFARSTHYLGEFGNGSRMKFVANLMVAIHNASAAEAFVLGMKAGLDPKMIYDVIADGAGSSRMFEVRGPMMVRGDFEPATMKVQVWQKDMKIIGEFARELDCPTPLLSTSAALYTAAMAQGRGTQDTAAVCAVLEEMARLRRPGSA